MIWFNNFYNITSTWSNRFADKRTDGCRAPWIWNKANNSIHTYMMNRANELVINFGTRWKTLEITASDLDSQASGDRFRPLIIHWLVQLPLLLVSRVIPAQSHNEWMNSLLHSQFIFQDFQLFFFFTKNGLICQLPTQNEEWETFEFQKGSKDQWSQQNSGKLVL